MDLLNTILEAVNSFAWGPIMIVLLVGTGLVLTIGTKFVQYRRIRSSFKFLFSKGDSEEGDISPFKALMTSLSATVGIGNIAGVATAIALGGPGAVFWMWITAIVGGATKFGEAVLAIKYRVTNDKGERTGGPMYYASKGMSDKFGGNWKWLGLTFAIFGVIASFGVGNMVQSNSVAAGLEQTFNMNIYLTGILLAVLTGLVILGGIKSIGNIAEKIVPFMAVIYIVSCLLVLFTNIDKVGEAFGMIFHYAFNGSAIEGGLIGGVIRFGVARGIFSNEAGLGSAPIAHAASKMKSPVKQGMIASLGCFIDTIIICSMTALVILVSGLVDLSSGKLAIIDGLNGAALTSSAFDRTLSGFGGYVVSLSLVFFAFSTIIGWYYYGSKCFEFIFGTKGEMGFKVFWVMFVFVGSFLKLDLIWNISDTVNGLMAIPNLVALFALSSVIIKMLKEYETNEKKV